MFKILVFLIAGVLIGAFANLSEKAVRLNSKMQFAGLMLLLFLMGASIGMNKSLISDLRTIGLDSLSYAAFATAFSVLFVYVISIKLFERN